MDGERLYAACQQDGSDAQVDAFTLLGEQLYRIAYGMLHDRPNGAALAQDCVQLALIKIHRNLDQCREPPAFRSWAAQVLRRIVIDELRRPEHRREVALPEDDHVSWLAEHELLAGTVDLHALLREVVLNGPLSERSRRVVLGRYFDNQPDELLAQTEAHLAGQPVLPAHIQVTRAKNLSVLRKDTALVGRLRELLV